MNQHQRKFLLDEIEKQYRREWAVHNEKKPKAPSLGNYLTAAILDGTAVMHSQGEIREAIRKRVRDLGKNEALFSSHGSKWAGATRDEDDREDCISIAALVLFAPPAGYSEVRAEYEKELKSWKDAGAVLEAAFNAMKLKVQVGSDKALEALVDQADKLCTMSLTASSRLLLKSNGAIDEPSV